MNYLVNNNANKERDTVLFINNLKIIKIFKNKNGKKRASVMDFIY